MMRLLLAAALATGCTDVYHYDQTNAGKPESGQLALRGKSSAQYLRGIYADLLGRTPDTHEIVIKVNGTEALRFTLDEQALLTGSLDGLGDSQPMRNLNANGLLHSAE